MAAENQPITYNFPGTQHIYRGKVRDVYTLQHNLLVAVASDRISAFDVILPKPIPHKGQVLNQTASHFLEATRHLVPNWLLATPHPTVSVGYRCEPIRLEMVIRGYLSGHAWRTYKSGLRTLCGVTLPEGMRENDRFSVPLVTPATKADEGHDEDISREEILKREIVTPQQLDQLYAYTHTLFEAGTHMAAQQGLILVDTKYEFGLLDDKIVLIDEIHTPDSSRYFYTDGYAERQAKGEPQQQLSKEFVREWLMSNGFQGREGERIPEMTEAFVNTVSQRYIQLYERVTGKSFHAASYQNRQGDIEASVAEAVKQLAHQNA